MTARTLYVMRPVTNAADILAWAKQEGVPNLMGADDLHVTIAFSRRPLDWRDIEPAAETLAVPGDADRVVKPLGDKGALVLGFKSSALARRWQHIRDAGASWDFPEYQPHVSLSYDAADFDASAVTPYTGPIDFGHEKFAEVDDDWIKTVKPEAKAASLGAFSAPMVNIYSTDFRRASGPPGDTGSMALSPKALHALVAFMKNVPAAAVDDIEQLGDYTTTDRDRVPSAAELGMDGKTFEARSGGVIERNRENTQAAPQEGTTKLYQELAARLGMIEKALKAMAEANTPAPASVTKSDTAVAAAAALRKARAAVRKAEDEDEDDDEDKEEAMDKAQRALDAAKVAVEKAEDDADDDEKEEMCEKARKSFRTAKAALATLRANRVAAKAAKVAAAEKAAAEVAAKAAAAAVTETTTAATTEAASAKSLDAIQVQIATLQDMFRAVQGRGVAQAPAITKATTVDQITAIAAKITEADDEGVLDGMPLLKAQSLLNRLKAVDSGQLARDVFDAELKAAPEQVRIFFPLAA